MKRTLLLMCMAVGSVAFGATLRFGSGEFEFGERGTMAVVNGGRRMKVVFGTVISTWQFLSEKHVKEYKVVRSGEDLFVAEGVFEADQSLLPFSYDARVKEGALALSIRCVAPEGVRFQKNSGNVLLRFEGKGEDVSGKLYDVCGTVIDMPQNNWYTWGKKLVFGPFQLSVEGERPASISVWGGQSSSNVRYPLFAKPVEGGTEYTWRGVFRTGDFKLEAPPNPVELGRHAYSLYLRPPAEPEFDPSKALKMLASKQLDMKMLGEIEQMLDLRSALYSALDIENHRVEENQEARALLGQAYAALNGMELERVRELLPKIEALQQDRQSWMPLTHFNPYAHIKDFDFIGFRKHPEGVDKKSPDAFRLEWQDGFAFSLAESGVVKSTSQTRNDEDIQMTSYSSHARGVSVVRDWVSDTWNVGKKRIRFSVLVPMIEVDGVTEFTMSKFTERPIGVSMVDASSVRRRVAIPRDAGPFHREIGEGDMVRPWMLVHFRHQTVALLPGKRPKSVSYDKGRLALKFDGEETYVCVVKLPQGNSLGMPGLAEHYARIAVAAPLRAFERVEGDRVVMTYSHSARKNDWGVVGKKIAPVPMLAVAGGVEVPGIKRMYHALPLGLFSYVEGERCEYVIPKTLRRLPMLRGINATWQGDSKEIKTHGTDGAHWIRLYIGKANPEAGLTVERIFEGVENALKAAREVKTKLLIDPHNLMYGAGEDGMPLTFGDDHPFLAMWDRLAALCSRYKDVVAGYDLYNELEVKWGAEQAWRALAQAGAERIRKHHPGAVIYMTGVDTANPSGYENYDCGGIDGAIASFHMYVPHCFTHQKIWKKRHPRDPYTFWPGYVGGMDWKNNSHYAGTTAYWSDRWALGASMSSLFRLYVMENIPLHCGELGVVGWANGRAFQSAFLWTRDVVELLEHSGAQWNLWNGGFGMGNKRVREYMHTLWKSGKDAK